LSATEFFLRFPISPPPKKKCEKNNKHLPFVISRIKDQSLKLHIIFLHKLLRDWTHNCALTEDKARKLKSYFLNTCMHQLWRINKYMDNTRIMPWVKKYPARRRRFYCLLIIVLLCVLSCTMCTVYFALLPWNLTCLHCLQNFFFEHLFNLYYRQWLVHTTNV